MQRLHHLHDGGVRAGVYKLGVGLRGVRPVPGVGEGVELRLARFAGSFAKEDVVIGVGVERRVKVNEVNTGVREDFCVAQPFEVIAKEQPDLVLVQGDTATTLCGALTAFYQHVPIGHVEAGLRTWDMAQPFPEEMNRVVTARLATLHFAATDWAARNLLAEGLNPARIHVTGNPGIDALLLVRDRLARVCRDAARNRGCTRWRPSAPPVGSSPRQEVGGPTTATGPAAASGGRSRSPHWESRVPRRPPTAHVGACRTSSGRRHEAAAHLGGSSRFPDRAFRPGGERFKGRSHRLGLGAPRSIRSIVRCLGGRVAPHRPGARMLIDARRSLARRWTDQRHAYTVSVNPV